MSELLQRSAVELAALVRAGDLTPRELVEASLRRIDELQPRINAFTHVAHEAALAEAETIGPGDPRPFAGVPIAVKDNRAVAEMPLTMCSDLLGDFVPRRDAFLVRRLRGAGFVIVGSSSSIRRSDASTSSRAVSSPLRTSAASSVAGRSSNSDTDPTAYS